MSKKICMLFIALVAMTSWAHEGTKVGIVDADIVIQESAKGVAFFKEYEVTIKKKREEIQNLALALQDKQKDYQAKAASLSAEKATALQVEMEQMKKSLDRTREDATRETQKVLDAKIDEFRRELGPLIRQVAQEKNLDLVFNKGPESNLVYASESIDITKDVIKKYDEMQ